MKNFLNDDEQSLEVSTPKITNLIRNETHENWDEGVNNPKPKQRMVCSLYESAPETDPQYAKTQRVLSGAQLAAKIIKNLFSSSVYSCCDKRRNVGSKRVYLNTCRVWPNLYKFSGLRGSLRIVNLSARDTTRSIDFFLGKFSFRLAQMSWRIAYLQFTVRQVEWR